MSKIAIVGSGFIGRAWAISFARAGHAVALWDAQAGAVDSALTYIDMLLPDLAGENLLRGASVAEIRGRMRAAVQPGRRAVRRDPCAGKHAGECRGQAEGLR